MLTLRLFAMSGPKPAGVACLGSLRDNGLIASCCSPTAPTILPAIHLAGQLLCWELSKARRTGLGHLRAGCLLGTVPPAFRDEVGAILHAFALATSLRVPHAVLASDSQSAIDVCFGRAHHAPDDKVSAAAVSLLQLATHCGTRIDWLKVASHTGCAFNDAADGVAKTANLPAAAPGFSFEGTALEDAIREGPVHFLWLAASSPRLAQHSRGTGYWHLDGGDLLCTARHVSGLERCGLGAEPGCLLDPQLPSRVL